MILAMISVTILTKNAEETLARTLEALLGMGEIILLDTGSTDRTLEIAASYPEVKIYQEPFLGFGPMHNRAVDLATYDWILSIDSDEVLSTAAREWIEREALDEGVVYSFPLHNYFNGKWIRSCGWYPDRHTRLFSRKRTRFTDAQVHEKIITKGMTQVICPEPILHYSYRSISDFLKKMESYTNLFAEQNVGKRSSSLWKAIGKSWFTFFRSYILKRGFLSGAEGYMISRYNAETAYYKYLKLSVMNKNGR